MKIENGKIIEITKNELYNLYLARGYDDCMDWHEFVNRWEETKSKIVEDKHD